MRRKLAGASAGLALVAVGVGVAAAGARDETTPQRKPIRLEVADLFIEVNATDGDAGLQMNLDGEDWRRLILRDPSGRTLMDVTNRGRLRGYGLTGMTFESSEPPFSEVPLRRF